AAVEEGPVPAAAVLQCELAVPAFHPAMMAGCKRIAEVKIARRATADQEHTVLAQFDRQALVFSGFYDQAGHNNDE
ncbi:MAG TPA: hypothetical protein VM223_28250, partial [Planctomycetota bacterium]|nr:hypothetical protein [Planctomycetota bacterium]